jgi:GalNAc-alpha-(1->4)-GalNAc-alpha-(1->3)-diNAcBac-PP-undecaprenol alpha-1,4-N-acetyl-D-galactosaminyltransferase
VVISFVHMVNIRVILALLGTGIPVVITEHNDPSHSKLPVPFGTIRRLVYPLAARLVTVGKGVDSGFRWFPASRRRVIYNPIPPPAVSEPANSKESQPPTIVAMGRLTRQKGFDMLIQAFSKVYADHPSWRLVILGEGPERNALERKVAELKLQGAVALPGFASDPLPYLLSSKIFAMSSRWEGFPMALGEAMAAGLPVVSFDCRSGPSEYITNEENGLLVEPDDVPALTHALQRLITDDHFRIRLGAQGKESLDRFALAPILDQWQELLASL